MARWAQVVSAEPELAALVRRLFDAGKHKTIATLRRDGSPRISGIEAEFTDEELTFGSMPDSRKGADLLRDPRLALHGPSVDASEDQPATWPGDAKISGRAVPVTAPGSGGPPGQFFRVDIAEVVLVRVGDPPDHLVIESWHEGRGRQQVRRG